MVLCYQLILRFSLILHKNTNWLLLVLLVFAGQTIAAPLIDIEDCTSIHSASENSNISMQHHDMDSMPESEIDSHEKAAADMGMTLEEHEAAGHPGH